MIFYRKLKLIQAITFDLDDTLYNNTPIIVNAERSLQEWMGQHFPITYNIDNKFWRNQQQKVLKGNPALKNDMGQLRLLSLHSGFQELGLTPSKAKAAAASCFEHFYAQRSNFKLSENIHSLLKILSKQLPIVAISNGNVDLDKIGLSPYFSACFKASLSMPMKPNLAMFKAAQNQLAIQAENILHIGDNLEKDVQGALAAGYQTAWYAEDRVMSLKDEQAITLPHVQLSRLEQLLDLI